MQAWRKYNELYSVSNDGQVRLDVDHMRSKAGKMIKPHQVGGGYYQVQVIINGRRQFKGVHRIVAEAWIPRLEGRHCVNHIDGNKANNHVSNLEWCTHAENMRHAAKNGLMNSGSTKVNRSPKRGAKRKYSPEVVQKLHAVFQETGSYTKAGKAVGMKRNYANYLIKKTA